MSYPLNRPLSQTVSGARTNASQWIGHPFSPLHSRLAFSYVSLSLQGNADPNHSIIARRPHHAVSRSPIVWAVHTTLSTDEFPLPASRLDAIRRHTQSRNHFFPQDLLPSICSSPARTTPLCLTPIVLLALGEGAFFELPVPLAGQETKES